MKNRALSRSKDEFYEQLLVAKDAARTGYEERLANDIEKLHLANERELSEVRSATQKVYDRENQTLREAKHDAEERLKQTSLKLNALERAYDDTRLALAQAQSDREAENGELRARTKVKEYELERAMISIEDKTKEIKSLEISLEQTKSRFNVLREEFARLDALSRASPGSIMNGGLLENSDKENRLSPHVSRNHRPAAGIPPFPPTSFLSGIAG